MHKNGDELPVWLDWKHEGWLVQLAIRSGAQATRVDGVSNGRLKLFVKAPPIEGRANQTIITAIAEAVDTTRSGVQLVSGLKSKQKSVRIELRRGGGGATLATARLDWALIDHKILDIFRKSECPEMNVGRVVF